MLLCLPICQTTYIHLLSRTRLRRATTDLDANLREGRDGRARGLDGRAHQAYLFGHSEQIQELLRQGFRADCFYSLPFKTRR
jgi:hypothetical protein